MDLFGLVNVLSLARNRYTLVIVDEYSRYIWVYCLQTKDEALEMIINFVKKMEVLNDTRVKDIRNDQGTKFKNSTLISFFEEKKGVTKLFSSKNTTTKWNF